MGSWFGIYLLIGLGITAWHWWASGKLKLRGYDLRRTLVSVLGWPIIMTVAIIGFTRGWRRKV